MPRPTPEGAALINLAALLLPLAMFSAMALSGQDFLVKPAKTIVAVQTALAILLTILCWINSTRNPEDLDKQGRTICATLTLQLTLTIWLIEAKDIMVQPWPSILGNSITVVSTAAYLVLLYRIFRTARRMLKTLRHGQTCAS